jgi:hypothetical protein
MVFTRVAARTFMTGEERAVKRKASKSDGLEREAPSRRSEAPGRGR